MDIKLTNEYKRFKDEYNNAQSINKINDALKELVSNLRNSLEDADSFDKSLAEVMGHDK